MPVTTACINLRKYSQNIKDARKFISANTRIMAVLKANAYGHGATRLAPVALNSGASYLAVAYLSEAVELRLNQINAPVLLLSKPVNLCTKKIVGLNLTQTIYNFDFAKKLNDTAKYFNKRTKVHLNIDTGMGRTGIQPDNALAFVNKLKDLKYLELEGIFTHFAKANSRTSSYTNQQLNKFLSVISTMEKHNINIPLKHAANSYATFNFPQSHLDMVRIGIKSYEKILVLTSHITNIQYLNTDSFISYDCTYQVKSPSFIATVSTGYEDGIPKSFSNRGMVLIKDKLYPVTGQVCMDMFMVNLGKNPFEAAIGDEVTIIDNRKSGVYFTWP
ncbi:MAG: alanine racemase [bacterium]|nr:alanine racemase [bacterium]